MSELPKTWDELRAWQTEGAKQQQAVIETMINKYYVKLRLQQTLKIIEKILNDKYSRTF